MMTLEDIQAAQQLIKQLEADRRVEQIVKDFCAKLDVVDAKLAAITYKAK